MRMTRRQWLRWLGISLVLGFSACADSVPSDSPVLDRVLGDKTLREQLVERGAADAEFVHEIQHQLGQGPDGDRKLARLLAEHLQHHSTLERAVSQEVAAHQEFQDWTLERLHGQQESDEKRELVSRLERMKEKVQKLIQSWEGQTKPMQGMGTRDH